MCVVSFVGDHFGDRWKPYIQPGWPGQGGAGGGQQDLNPLLPATTTTIFMPGVTQEQFDQLRKEVMEMKELLKAAKLIDEKTNQPDCEMEEKLKVLRAVAEAMGVTLDDVFPKK